MEKRHIPNLITIIRFILVLPIAICLLNKKYDWAFYLFILAGISDGIDGFLARRFLWQSKMGAILDPLADKALMTTTYLLLGYLGNLPVWLVGIVIGRDLFIIIGVIFYRKLIEEPEYFATFISKLNTVLQLTLAILVLFNQVYHIVSITVVDIGAYVVASTTLSSLLDYIWLWGKRALIVLRIRKIQQNRRNS